MRGREGYRVLWAGCVALPLLAGVDKFFNVLGPWREYLAPDLPDLLGVSPYAVMQAVGVAEILLAVLVALRPAMGGWLLAVWLWATVGNLLVLPGHYDVALRDLVLSLAAIALARLAPHFEPAAAR